MAEKFFVDTNILIYAHDRTAGRKHQLARQLVERLWISGEGVLSTQVMQELCVNLRRKISRPLPLEDIRRLVQDYLSWEIVVNTPQSVIEALETVGSDARYSRPATVTLATRSGTNQFHGSAFETHRNNGAGLLARRGRQDADLGPCPGGSGEPLPPSPSHRPHNGWGDVKAKGDGAAPFCRA